MIEDQYNYAGGCGALHPFNKERRAECEQNRTNKKANSPKSKQADADKILAQAAAIKASQQEEPDKWTPLAITGVIAGSFLLITIMVIVIKRAKSK